MELLRPTYHFMPEQNWMNDPNGVCYYQGAYHLFYQYNPNGSQWGDIHWGHAKSTDFLHWERLPMALTPSTELGELHCFSGCAVVSEDKPLLFYTSVGEGSRNAELGAEQWMAIGDESFTHFEKYTKNPLLTKDDHGNLTVTDWRDPFVVKKDDRFYMVLGATIEQHGCALLYHSDDLIHWEFLQILAEGTAEERIWECPNLLFFGDTCVLVISPGDTPRYLMGRLTPEHTLSIEAEGMLDHCGMEGFYAPNSFLDPEGRTLMIGWITENSRQEMGKNLKWSGAQSIPRVLSIENQILHMAPIPELQALRQQEETYTNLVCSTCTTLPFQTRSRVFELELNLHLDPDSLLTIDVLASSHSSPEEKTTILIDGKANAIHIDRSHSSLDAHCSKTPLQALLPIVADNNHEIRLFTDHSILEIFVDTQTVLTTRIYPTLETSDHITLTATQANITKATLWELDALTYQ